MEVRKLSDKKTLISGLECEVYIVPSGESSTTEYFKNVYDTINEGFVFNVGLNPHHTSKITIKSRYNLIYRFITMDISINQLDLQYLTNPLEMNKIKHSKMLALK